MILLARFSIILLTLTITRIVEDIDLGVTRQEGRVTLRVIARSPELSFKIMGQRWAETRRWRKARSTIFIVIVDL